MAYIGRSFVTGSFSLDTFSGDGTTVAFTMGEAGGNANALEVVVNSVIQTPNNYTVAGSALTFVTAPSTGTDNIWVRHLGRQLEIGTPPDGSITTAKIVDNAVTTAKIINDAVTSAKLASGLALEGVVDILGSVVENADTIAASTITVSNAGYHYKTITGATTFIFSGAPASGKVGSFTLELTNPSTNITWPTSVDWDGGSAPTLTVTGVDILTFTTRDGGTKWLGFVAGKDMK